MISRRRIARWCGLLWVIAVAVAGAVLIIHGRLGANRASMIFLFFAALPGAMAYRWGAAGWEEDLRPARKPSGRTPTG